MDKKNLSIDLKDIEKSPQRYIKWFLSKPERLIIDYLYLKLDPIEEQAIDHLAEKYALISDLLIKLMNHQLNNNLKPNEMMTYLIENQRAWFIEQLIQIRSLLGDDPEAFKFNKPFPKSV